MFENNQSRSTKGRGRLIAVALAVIAPAIGMATASAAVAKTKQPTGDFAVFAPCPRFTAGVNFCFNAKTNGGHAKLGNQSVPITVPLTLQGGLSVNKETGTETFVEALNGETLSKAAEPVPGGILGLINCKELTNPILRANCEALFENGLTGVNAITELARPANEIGISKTNLVEETGTALSLPVKIHLENPLLGTECYIGSSARPVIWNLTTGTTHPPFPGKPLTGAFGTGLIKDESTFIEITGNKLVGNEFTVPVANGCGGIFAFLLDPILDLKLGLPARAGASSAILENAIVEAPVKAVIKSEKKV